MLVQEAIDRLLAGNLTKYTTYSERQSQLIEQALYMNKRSFSKVVSYVELNQRTTTFRILP